MGPRIREDNGGGLSVGWGVPEGAEPGPCFVLLDGGKGYFGPGELPHFNHDFFEIPHGRAEDVLFEKFKTKLNNHEIPDGPVGDDTLREFKKGVEEILARPDSDSMFAVLPEEA